MSIVTIQQVADAAGVSRSTANKVLLGESALFRESTAQKVLKSAEALGYKPNLLARGLRQQRSFLLGTMLSSVNAPFAYELYSGIQGVAAEYDCAPVTFSCSDPEQETSALDICINRQVDALLINSAPKTTTPKNQRRILKLADGGLSMIEVFGRNLPGIPSIVCDFRHAGYEATSRLIADGLREIVYWSPFAIDDQAESTPRAWYAYDMFRGYQAAMREAGLPPSLSVFDDKLKGRAARHESIPPAYMTQAHALLTGHPDLQGIVTASEMPANAISNVLQREPTLARPGFTQASMDLGRLPLGLLDQRILIRVPAREIGAAAAGMALQQLKGDKPNDRAVAPTLHTAQ